jgi:hypothetical protein
MSDTCSLTRPGFPFKFTVTVCCKLPPRPMFPVSRATTVPLSLRDAHLINAALTFGYVLPLHLTKFTRLSFAKTSRNDGSRPKGPSERWRDDPAVIKARLLSVSISTIASLWVMYYIVTAVQSDPQKVRKRCLLRTVAHTLFTDWMGYDGRSSRFHFAQRRSPCALRDASSIPWSPVLSVPRPRSAFHDELDVHP